MNTNQLEYFLELAQTLNYRRAAEKIGITQPTLTKAIQHLEGDLGFPLFLKQGRSIRLSPQGIVFRRYAQGAVDQLDQGIQAALREHRVLRLGAIAAMPGNIIPSFMGAYQKVYPGAYVRIRNDVSFALQDLLEEDELDLILCSPSERYSDIVFFDLAEQPLYVCLYPTHPLAKRKELLPEDLAGQAMVSHTKNGLFYKLYEGALKDLTLHPRIVAEADEDNSLLSLVRSRLGLCIVAMNPTLNTQGLVTVPFRQNKVKRLISLGCKKSRLEEFDLKAILRQLEKI